MTGIVLLKKPRRLSSNTAVNIVKRAAGATKAGHLGTLDVEAEGLLPIALGSCTKLFDLYLNKNKEYITTFKFGEERDTFDLEGQITRTDDKKISKEDMLKSLPTFLGKVSQMPPAYSAKKINGMKAYELAREGKEPTLNPKEIEIYNFELIEEKEKNLFVFKVACSSGTYIRELCRDLAASLSTCGVCYEIIRTKCGDFKLKDAFSLEDVKTGKFSVIAPEDLFSFEKVEVSKENEIRILNGQILPCKLKDGRYNLFGSTFLGLADAREGKLKLEIRLN